MGDIAECRGLLCGEGISVFVSDAISAGTGEHEVDFEFGKSNSPALTCRLCLHREVRINNYTAL